MTSKPPELALRRRVMEMLADGKLRTRAEIAAELEISAELLDGQMSRLISLGYLDSMPKRYTLTATGLVSNQRRTERSQRAKKAIVIRVHRIKTDEPKKRPTRNRSIVSPALSGQIPNSVFALGRVA